MKVHSSKAFFFLFCCLGLILFSSSDSAEKNIVKTNSPVASKTLWLDLITPNIAESSKFYTQVFGWTFKTYNFNGNNHAHIYNNGGLIGGMVEVKKAQASTWIGSYPVSLEDLKSLRKGIESAGLKPALQLINVPERGRQVIFESPQGEEFALILEGELTKNLNNTESKNTWLGMELWSSDVKASESFYEKAFGVEVAEKEFDDKPYWVFSNNANTIAGMIKNPVKNQGSQWVPYMKGNDLNALVSSIEAANGTVLLKPRMDVRSGKVILAQDPNGAIFAIQKTN
jgi:hypothetical protein